MQTKEFADKFNELTEGWKPTVYPDIGYFNKAKYDLLGTVSFVSMGMDYETYVRFRNSDIRAIEWGLIHKVIIHGLSVAPPTAELWIHPNNYISLVSDFYPVFKEISDFIAKQREESVKSVFLQLKAKNSLIK